MGGMREGRNVVCEGRIPITKFLRSPGSIVDSHRCTAVVKDNTEHILPLGIDVLIESGRQNFRGRTSSIDVCGGNKDRIRLF